MNEPLQNDLAGALSAMEAGFHVRLIGTFEPDLVPAPAEANATTWLAENHLEYDQFPVEHNGSIVGVLLRQTPHLKGKRVLDVMQPLCERIMVSADLPIAELIPLFREHHYRLILRGSRIDGLVTQSDLVKLPLRMMLFGFVTHLEMCLRELIKRRVGPNWMSRLNSKRQQNIRTEFTKFKRARFEPDPLEFTLFSDAITVLCQETDLGVNFATDMKLIKKLRNDLAHAKTFVSSPEEVRAFVDCFETLRRLISQITETLKSCQ